MIYTEKELKLLDHFAGLAMQGMLAHDDWGVNGDIADYAYKHAAKMIAKRNEIYTKNENIPLACTHSNKMKLATIDTIIGYKCLDCNEIIG